MDRIALQAKVLSRIVIEDRGFSTPCWIATWSKDRKGYTVIWWDGGKHRTHRAAYTAFVGDIPEGLVIDHLCRVRACCNPDHLEPVTNRVNCLRGEASRTSCPNGHERTPENTYVDKSGKRECKPCKVRRVHKRRARATSPSEAGITSIP